MRKGGNAVIEDNNVYEITIIGGGPTGLFATFYAGMRGSSVKLIDTMPKLGGQLCALYPEKYIYDVAGFTKIKAGELITRLQEQASRFNPTLCLEERVEKIDKLENGDFLITTTEGTHLSKTIIITAGIGAFEPRRLELPNAGQFEQTNLHYFVDDIEIFRDKRVLIFGGGDSAVDWALMLKKVTKELTLIHRRDKFRAHEYSVELLYKSDINILVPRVISELVGVERIEKVVLADPKTGEAMEELEIDELVVNHGFISSLGPISAWGIELENGLINVDTTMKTNIDGVYAAGDIANYLGKIKLITTGFGEAAIAVSNAKHYVHPEERLQPPRMQSLE